MKLKSPLALIAISALSAALLTAQGAAQAALTVYTSEASFLAALSTAGVDSFDDLDPTAALAQPLNRSAGSYSYSASVGNSGGGFWPAGTLGGDAWLGVDQPQDTVTFNAFSGGVNAVGGFFFGNDLYGAFTTAQQISVSASDAGGSLSQALLTPGTGSFLGFISTGAISSLQVWVGAQGSGEAGVWPAINNLTLGHALAVPEPQTYALLLSGLGLVGLMARRRLRT